VLKLFVVALPALALPFLIRSFVIEGIATATEVSTVGIVYVLIAGIVIYRSFDTKTVYPVMVQCVSLSGAILLIIGTATAMAWALTQSGFSTNLAELMRSVPGGSAGFLAISIVVFVILGSVLEGIPAIVLFGPLLFPIAQSMHIDPVHYAMVVVLAMGIGLFCPPFGVGYYAACAIGGVHPSLGLKRIWPYMYALVAGLVVVAAAKKNASPLERIRVAVEAHLRAIFETDDYNAASIRIFAQLPPHIAEITVHEREAYVDFWRPGKPDCCATLT
jgi:tripartite ATP-independent transporter DctM subunit